MVLWNAQNYFQIEFSPPENYGMVLTLRYGTVRYGTVQYGTVRRCSDVDI